MFAKPPTEEEGLICTLKREIESLSRDNVVIWATSCLPQVSVGTEKENMIIIEGTTNCRRRAGFTDAQQCVLCLSVHAYIHICTPVYIVCYICPPVYIVCICNIYIHVVCIFVYIYIHIYV